jgi:hypothetical protein
MKAAVCEQFGPPEVLQIREAPKPEPGDDEVLIKAFATSVTRYDVWARSCHLHTGMNIMMRMFFWYQEAEKTGPCHRAFRRNRNHRQERQRPENGRSRLWVSRNEPGGLCRIPYTASNQCGP